MKESTPNERAASVNADKTKTTEGIPRFILVFMVSVSILPICMNNLKQINCLINIVIQVHHGVHGFSVRGRVLPRHDHRSVFWRNYDH